MALEDATHTKAGAARHLGDLVSRRLTECVEDELAIVGAQVDSVHRERVRVDVQAQSRVEALHEASAQTTRKKSASFAEKSYQPLEATAAARKEQTAMLEPAAAQILFHLPHHETRQAACLLGLLDEARPVRLDGAEEDCSVRHTTRSVAVSAAILVIFALSFSVAASRACYPS